MRLMIGLVVVMVLLLMARWGRLRSRPQHGAAGRLFGAALSGTGDAGQDAARSDGEDGQRHEGSHRHEPGRHGGHDGGAPAHGGAAGHHGGHGGATGHHGGHHGGHDGGSFGGGFSHGDHGGGHF